MKSGDGSMKDRSMYALCRFGRSCGVLYAIFIFFFILGRLICHFEVFDDRFS